MLSKYPEFVINGLSARFKDRVEPPSKSDPVGGEECLAPDFELAVKKQARRFVAEDIAQKKDRRKAS